VSATIEPSSEPPRRRGLGRPFKPGQSGYPGGGRRAFRKIVDELTAELGGGPLLPSQRLMVEQVADLKLRSRKAPATEAVRIANATAKLLALLKADQGEQRDDGPTLGSILKGAHDG